MSRLLFAAARGARIQINGFTATVPSWYDSHKWSSMHESVLRIHPDDEHLQYGPISTAVLEVEMWELTSPVSGGGNTRCHRLRARQRMDGYVAHAGFW